MIRKGFYFSSKTEKNKGDRDFNNGWLDFSNFKVFITFSAYEHGLDENNFFGLSLDKTDHVIQIERWLSDDIRRLIWYPSSDFLSTE